MVEVTDEDRREAERLAIGQPFSCFDCADELAQAFARHRIAAEQRGKLEGARLAIEAAADKALNWCCPIMATNHENETYRSISAIHPRPIPRQDRGGMVMAKRIIAALAAPLVWTVIVWFTAWDSPPSDWTGVTRFIVAVLGFFAAVFAALLADRTDLA